MKSLPLLNPCIMLVHDLVKQVHSTHFKNPTIHKAINQLLIVTDYSPTNELVCSDKLIIFNFTDGLKLGIC